MASAGNLPFLEPFRQNGLQDRWSTGTFTAVISRDPRWPVPYRTRALLWSFCPLTEKNICLSLYRAHAAYSFFFVFLLIHSHLVMNSRKMCSGIPLIWVHVKGCHYGHPSFPHNYCFLSWRTVSHCGKEKGASGMDGIFHPVDSVSNTSKVY